MFEQAFVSSGPGSKRAWTTFMGVAGQVLLVAVAVLVPIVSPQVMPRAVLFTTIPPPTPAPLPPKPEPTIARVIPVSTGTALPVHDTRLFEPPRVPTRVPILVDQAPETVRLGVPGAADLGQQGGRYQIVDSILRSAGGETVPVRPAEPSPEAARPVSEPRRIKVGGLVQAGRLLFMAQPQYPILAKQARVSGTVQLEGIIGTDGRIRELKVLSGHPLLVPAAVEAVRQWVYRPTTLNGDPVEVVAPITVTFRMN
jgi:protein TonB